MVLYKMFFQSLNAHKRIMKTLLIALFCLCLQGCLGTIVGSTVDVAIEVVKIPFKVAGAAVDVVSGDGDSKKKKREHDNENFSDEGSSTPNY